MGAPRIGEIGLIQATVNFVLDAVANLPRIKFRPVLLGSSHSVAVDRTMEWVVDCGIHSAAAAVRNTGIRCALVPAIAFLAADATSNGKPEAGLISHIRTCMIRFAIM